MTLIGQPAPRWCAAAYEKGEEVELTGERYAGRWYVLYWYPLDFTFICPTEIRGFQALLGEFQAEGADVIGASTDSFYSHQHWFADRDTFKEKITHPVIGDTTHALTRSFGVLKEEQGVAYRATAVVDDEGTIRSLSVNDLSAGRSPAEVLRTVQALKSGGLCSADWNKGDAFAT
jgi:alkyl hydroperoxide reductase subunit AhpC